MERSRLTYEVTNQQLMAVITKLSSQLARAKLPPPPQQKGQNNLCPLMKESHMPVHLMRMDEVDMGGAASAPR